MLYYERRMEGHTTQIGQVDGRKALGYSLSQNMEKDDCGILWVGWLAELSWMRCGMNTWDI